MDEYSLDYYYGLEAEEFSFIRVPKLLITLPIYKCLTSDDKLLYGILLDRMGLSVKNRWIDGEGRVYIIFTIDDVMNSLNCAEHKAVKMMSNLENKAHLIERKRQGQGKPSIIYVKKFVPGRDAQFLNCQNDNSGIAESATQDLSKEQCNNTDINNTEINKSFLFSSPEVRKEEMRKRAAFYDYFRGQLQFDLLMEAYPDEEDSLNGMLDLLVDTCSSSREWILISGDRMPLETVRSRFMKLDPTHIEYVLQCLSENTTRVRNMKQYLLATLYNAPTTMSPHYQSWAKSDMACGKV